MLDIPRLFASPSESTAYRSRREFLARAGGGFGMLALADLAPGRGAEAGRGPARAARAALRAEGQARHLAVHERRAVSQVDTWDYKPELEKRDGQELQGVRPATPGFFTDQVGPLMKSPFKFAKHGQCGKMGQRTLPEHGEARRQDGVHPLAAGASRTTIRPRSSR